MVILLLLHDIGSSLMFYGALLAMLYVATRRVSFVIVGLVAFGIGAWYLGTHIPHIDARVEAWLHPFNPALYNKIGGSFQVANGDVRAGGRRPVRAGLRPATLTIPSTHPAAYLLPAPDTDMIYAVITDELGLFGAPRCCSPTCCSSRAGSRPRSSPATRSRSCWRRDCRAVLALQVFVIVGGVTRVIPLTGVTLPFVSYGGSSILANFVLVALLLLVSDRARRPDGAA